MEDGPSKKRRAEETQSLCDTLSGLYSRKRLKEEEIQEIESEIRIAEELLNNLLQQVDIDVPEILQDENDMPVDIIRILCDQLCKNKEYFWISSLMFVNKKWNKAVNEWLELEHQATIKLAVKQSIKSLCLSIPEDDQLPDFKGKNLLAWGIQMGCTIDQQRLPNYTKMLAYVGNLDLVKRFLNYESKVDSVDYPSLVSIASEMGHLLVLDFLMNSARYYCPLQSSSLLSRVLKHGAKGGKINILDWGLMNGGEFTGEEYSHAVTKNSTTDTLDWLNFNYCPINESSSKLWNKVDYPTENALKNNKMVCLEWLITNGWKWKGSEMEIAVMKMDLDLIIWLLRQECPWGEDPNEEFWSNIDPEFQLKLDELGCPWPSLTETIDIHKAQRMEIDTSNIFEGGEIISVEAAV